MEDKLIKDLENVRERYESRLDGGAGSGNWGHVGVIGRHGGSAPGGGGAFRISNHKSKIPYTSQAKIRVKNKNAIIKAKKALGNAKTEKQKAYAQKRLDNANKKASNVNMKQKSASHLKNKGVYNENASKNILADKKGAGKKTWNNSHQTGTKANMHNTFKNISKKKKKSGV